jgi:hypothetical protein
VGFAKGKGYAPKILYAQAGRRFLRLSGKSGDGAFHEHPEYRGARPGRGAYRGIRLATGRDGERRKVEAAFDLDGILRGIRKAEQNSGAALAIVKALKERGLIDNGAVPAGKGSVKFMDFLTDFWDYEKSPYVRDRLAHRHSIGRSYCGINGRHILNYRLSAFTGRTLASVTATT